MKQYKLLRDLPRAKAGAIYEGNLDDVKMKQLRICYFDKDRNIIDDYILIEMLTIENNVPTIKFMDNYGLFEEVKEGKKKQLTWATLPITETPIAENQIRLVELHGLFKCLFKWDDKIIKDYDDEYNPIYDKGWVMDVLPTERLYNNEPSTYYCQASEEKLRRERKEEIEADIQKLQHESTQKPSEGVTNEDLHNIESILEENKRLKDENQELKQKDIKRSAMLNQIFDIFWSDADMIKFGNYVQQKIDPRFEIDIETSFAEFKKLVKHKAI